MDDKLDMSSKYYWILFIYLIIFPSAGGVVGYIFYFMYELIGNAASDFHLKLFIFVWFLFGLLAGIYGIYLLNKIKKRVDTE